LAWREFKKGKTRKREIQEFEFNLEDNIFRLHQELVNKTYIHGPYQSFYVCDPKLRHIHKATIRDRLVHQALFRVLYQIFDRRFIYDSYSCRLGKGTHRGVKRLEKFILRVSDSYRQPAFALKLDIRKFFDHIDKDILFTLIARKVKDADTLELIKMVIDSFAKNLDRSLPLGNVTSQLFANIYLNELDQFIKHNLKQKFYLRYCDDFIILHQSKEYLTNLLVVINDFLKEKLKLQIHPNKIILRKISQGVDFLGYVVLPHHIILRTRTKKRILRLVNRKNLQSYLGVLKHARARLLQQKLLERVLFKAVI